MLVAGSVAGLIQVIPAPGCPADTVVAVDGYVVLSVSLALSVAEDPFRQDIYLHCPAGDSLLAWCPSWPLHTSCVWSSTPSSFMGPKDMRN